MQRARYHGQGGRGTNRSLRRLIPVTRQGGTCGRFPAEPALWNSDVGEEPQLYRRGGVVSGAGDRRDNGDLQRGERGAAAATAVRARRPAGESVHRVPELSQWRAAALLGIAARVPGSQTRCYGISSGRGLGQFRGQSGGRERAGAFDRRLCDRRPAADARRDADSGPPAESRGRCGQRTAHGGDLVRPVAARIRRRGFGTGPRHTDEWQPMHGGGDHAEGLRFPAGRAGSAGTVGAAADRPGEAGRARQSLCKRAGAVEGGHGDGAGAGGDDPLRATLSGHAGRGKPSLPSEESSRSSWPGSRKRLSKECGARCWCCWARWASCC